MVDGSKAVSSSVKSESEVPAQKLLPYRPVNGRPTGIFVDAVIQQLKEHAQPEIIDVLYRNSIPKDVEFYKLRPITLDGKKRPNGDLAPCPMCAPNKFLSGFLIYVPSMQCCAVIGHCCAGKEAQARADREYKLRNQRDHEETYLLQCLPLVDARMAVLASLKAPTAEALRLYRKFRKGAPHIHSQLRSTKHQFSGRLMISEIIRGGEDDESENDYFGPAGFRGRGALDIQTREHDYGLLVGAIAVNADYNPVKDLVFITRQLEAVHSLPSEEAALEFIVTMTTQERRAAVALLEGVDKGAAKLVQRLTEFTQFFAMDNVRVLEAFGASPHNNLGFRAEFEILHNRPCLTLRQSGTKCVLHVGATLSQFKFEWPGPARAERED